MTTICAEQDVLQLKKHKTRQCPLVGKQCHQNFCFQLTALAALFYVLFDPELMICCSSPSGGVLGAGGDSALLTERRRHLPAAGRRLQQADGQQHATHHGPQAEGRLPQKPGGVCGQRGRPALRQITTGNQLRLESSF